MKWPKFLEMDSDEDEEDIADIIVNKDQERKALKRYKKYNKDPEDLGYDQVSCSSDSSSNF